MNPLFRLALGAAVGGVGMRVASKTLSVHGARVARSIKQNVDSPSILSSARLAVRNDAFSTLGLARSTARAASAVPGQAMSSAQSLKGKTRRGAKAASKQMVEYTRDGITRMRKNPYYGKATSAVADTGHVAAYGAHRAVARVNDFAHLHALDRVERMTAQGRNVMANRAEQARSGFADRVTSHEAAARQHLRSLSSYKY
jgi:hypothetical protein